MPWKVGRDRGAGARENRGRKKKGREAGSLRWQEAGEKFKKASFHYLLLLIIQSKKRTQQLFLDFHLTFSEAESKILSAKKVKKQKFVLGIKKKKQHYFKWNWKPFQVAYIIGHEWDGMTHVQACRLCQLCQCLLCLAKGQENGIYGKQEVVTTISPPPPSSLKTVATILLNFIWVVSSPSKLETMPVMFMK